MLLARTLTLTLLAGLTAAVAYANHPVLVEGNNCSDLGPGVIVVPPGTCGDYDGDGFIGTAEDTDNANDRIFGTIGAALGAANGGANQNGRVTIVTSGRFPEVVTITAANGNVTLEAAPGVEANIDAVLAGDPGNAARQGAPGIIVDAMPGRHVTLRNLVSRNWREGILVKRDSRVTIDHCRVENNRDFGIRVAERSRVAVIATQVTATGFRSNPDVDNTPTPGTGIRFGPFSTGSVDGFTAVTGSFAAGLARLAGAKVTRGHVILFDNNPNCLGCS